MNRKNLLSTVLFFFFIASLIGQSGKKSFNQEDFDQYKIDENVYNFWWYKNDNIWFPKGDTIPYLVDDREYKGLINYGLKFSLVERRNLNYVENFEMYKLKIEIEYCKVSLKDSVVNIKGIVKGGWSNNTIWGYKKRENNVDVFIGKNKDTTKFKYLNHLFKPEKITTTYKDEKINDHILLDTFPAKYIHSYAHFRTEPGTDRTFKIKSKIDNNSVLIFGLTNTYAEIYEIGKLVFSDKKNRRRKKLINKDDFSYPKVIIRNNIHRNENYNIHQKKKSNYHKITEKAENYIVLRQYGKAKPEYDRFLDGSEYVFARDMHNAVRCAIKARDYNTAIVWCKKLVSKGVPLTYFEDKIFTTLKKKPVWMEFLTNYSSLYDQFKKGLNQNLITGIQKLVEEDQKYYIKNSKGEINSLDLANKTEEIDQQFIKLIKKEGFPTEEKIGLRTDTDGHLIFESPSYFVLLVHSYQTKSNKQKEIKELFEGNKVFYDTYRSNLGVFKKSGMTCLQIYKGNLYNNKTCGANLGAIQKMKFKFNNEYNFIIDTGEFTIIPYEKNSEEEDEKFIRDNFNFVTKLTDDWFFYE